LARENTAAGIYAQPGQFLSYNWAGYATFDQTAGSVTKVSGTWVQPAVTCTSNGTQYVALWVGIDGFTTDAVEQTGTVAICHNGVASYHAWWELFPTNAIQVINTFRIHAGDAFYASVVYHGAGMFTMHIADKTTGGMFTVTAAQAPAFKNNPAENSAECIIERPAEISNGNEFLLHLANFGTTTFSSCKTTISGASSGVGNFAPSAILYMIGEASTANHIIYLASPGGATNLNKWAFTTTWQGYK
jgi:hypothetical protein